MVITIVESGNFYTRENRLNMVTCRPGMACRYRVHVQKFVPIALQSSCTSEEELEEQNSPAFENPSRDDMRLEQTHGLLMARHGCTIPWLSHHVR